MHIFWRALKGGVYVPRKQKNADPLFTPDTSGARVLTMRILRDELYQKRCRGSVCAGQNFRVSSLK